MNFDICVTNANMELQDIFIQFTSNKINIPKNSTQNVLIEFPDLLLGQLMKCTFKIEENL